MKTLRYSAFTLIELLVVIVIIAVLAGLALPVIGRVQASARATKCLSQLRQIGVASQAYANDNDGDLPRTQHQHESWVGRIQPYAGGTVLYRCPDDPEKLRTYSYAVNDFLTPNPYGASNLNYSRRSNIPTPSASIYMAECHAEFTGSDHFHFAAAEDGGYTPASFAQQVAVDRHGKGANYLFADGHAESLQWSAVQKKLTAAGSAFVHPGGNP